MEIVKQQAAHYVQAKSKDWVTETYLNSVHPADIHVTVRDHKCLNRLVLSCCATATKKQQNDGKMSHLFSP